MEPSCITQPVALHTQPNDGRGDCLFQAVAQALNGYKGVATPAAVAHFKMLGLGFGAVTATQLRTLVYMLFLVKNKETDGVLDTWKMLKGVDGALSAEFGQVRVLPSGVPADQLTPAHRTRLFRACMDKRVCWGDETALEFMERLLCIRCFVVANKTLQTRALGNYPADFRPLLYVALGLAHVHYQSVLWTDAFGREHGAFAEQEIPDVFLFLSQRDCGMVVDKPFIHLRGRIHDRVHFPGVAPVAAAHSRDDRLLRHFVACRAALSFLSH
jgi:hypothetical protein